MTQDDLKTIAAIIGGILGALGFLYGLLKDRKLKEIEKRAKAPHFTFRNLQIDAAGKSIPAGRPSYYSYKNQESNLSDRLFGMDSYENEVPGDYPDGRVVGVVLANKGSDIRFFTVNCREEHVFRRCKMEEHCFEFRYKLYKSQMSEPLQFMIKFETEAGYRGKQTWEIQRGTGSLKRVQPKAV